jgi:hypothetical protein
MLDEAKNLEMLERMGIEPQTAVKLLASGFFPHQMPDSGNRTKPCIVDSFYGNKFLSGLLNSEDITRADYPKASAREYEVSSIADIERLLSDDKNARWRPLMSFRGQNCEYFTERPFPNPVLSVGGKERLILPGVWRKYTNRWNDRFADPPYQPFFSSMYGDELIYHGIPDWRSLPDINLERYGLHTVSDLEDFPDPESQEYFRRWSAFKLGISSEPALVEQHYGIDTCGLDVTFSLGAAAFFALNKFVKSPDGTAHYEPIVEKKREGVIYCFVFRDPGLTETADLVRDVPIFRHIQPVRPVRQACALPFFHKFNINQAVTDLHMVLRLRDDFRMDSVAEASHLFPSADDDPFYKAALEAKQRHSTFDQPLHEDPYLKFVEYRL